MTNHAIIAGTFAHAVAIKTRSIFQLIVELPIEQADAALKSLGGWPQPGKEKPVAVALLNGNSEPKAKRGSLAQQAGILCSEPVFAKFLEETHPHIEATDTAYAVRQICGVDSRAEFDSDPAKGQLWRSLKGKFDAWKML